MVAENIGELGLMSNDRDSEDLVPQRDDVDRYGLWPSVIGYASAAALMLLMFGLAAGFR